MIVRRGTDSDFVITCSKDELKDILAALEIDNNIEIEKVVKDQQN